MSTALQIIGRSLRKINALMAGETVPSDMSTDALADLNAMLSRWLDSGIEIARGEVTLTDTVPTDISDEDAVVYNLSKILLLEYPNSNGLFIIKLADEYYRNILQKYDEPGELQLEPGLQILTNVGYNINTDS